MNFYPIAERDGDAFSACWSLNYKYSAVFTSVAQRTEQVASIHRVAGSTPAGGISWKGGEMVAAAVC